MWWKRHLMGKFCGVFGAQPRASCHLHAGNFPPIIPASFVSMTCALKSTQISWPSHSDWKLHRMTCALEGLYCKNAYHWWQKLYCTFFTNGQYRKNRFWTDCFSSGLTNFWVEVRVFLEADLIVYFCYLLQTLSKRWIVVYHGVTTVSLDMAHKPPAVLHGVPVEFLYAPRPWNYSAQCYKPPAVVPPRCSVKPIAVNWFFSWWCSGNLRHGWDAFFSHMWSLVISDWCLLGDVHRAKPTLLRFIFGPQDCITPQSFQHMEQLPCPSKSSELQRHVCFSPDHKGWNSDNCLKLISIVPKGQPQVVHISQLVFPFVLCKRSPQKNDPKVAWMQVLQFQINFPKNS